MLSSQSKPKQSKAKWIKVLNIVMHDRFGGIASRVITLARELKSWFIETIILAPRGSDEIRMIAERERVRIVEARIARPKKPYCLCTFLSDVLYPLELAESIREIVKIIQREKVDIIHANGLFCFPPVLAAQITGRPVVWQLVGSGYPLTIVRWLMPFVIHSSDRIIFVSHKMKTFYLGNFSHPVAEKKSQVIYMPVDTGRFDPTKVNTEDIKMLRYQLGLEVDNVVVGCVANVSPDKGFEYLIPAIDMVRKVVPQVRFVLVGGRLPSQHAYAERIDRTIKDKSLEDYVIWVPPRFDMERFMMLFDILVLPSIAEGMPLVILEAMALGIPVVATKVGGVEEQVIHQKSGFVVPSKNSQALARALIKLLTNKDMRLNMGKNAKQIVQEKFNLTNCAKTHAELYRSLFNYSSME